MLHAFAHFLQWCLLFHSHSSSSWSSKSSILHIKKSVAMYDISTSFHVCEFEIESVYPIIKMINRRILYQNSYDHIRDASSLLYSILQRNIKVSEYQWIEDHTDIDRSDLKNIDAYVNVLHWSSLIIFFEVRIFGIFLISYFRIGVTNHDVWRVKINVEKTQLVTASHKWDSNHFAWNLLLDGYIFFK